MNKKTYDIIFLSLAQDCASSLYLYFKFLKTFPKNLKKKIIIAENNSKDNTRDVILNYLKLNDEITLVKTDFLNRVDERILRITKGRLFLQKYIIKNNLRSRFVCLIDLDDVLNKNMKFKDFNKILLELKNKEKILNGISVKSKPFYYDILAFKCDKFYLPNILEMQRSKKIISAYSERKKYIYSLQRKINKEKKLKTISSFNGLCVYNFKDYIKGNYFLKDSNKKKVTLNEHMKFNISLHQKNGKYIMINDNFFLSTPKEHLPANSFFEFWNIKINNYIKRILK